MVLDFGNTFRSNQKWINSNDMPCHALTLLNSQIDLYIFFYNMIAEHYEYTVKPELTTTSE